MMVRMSANPQVLIMNNDQTFASEYDGYLTIPEWAERHDVTERSVKRWLADGEIPGAEQRGEKRKWYIPETAVRTRKSPAERAATELVPVAPTTAEITVTEPELDLDEEFDDHLWRQDLQFYLDRMPAYIPIRIGAAMLGLGVEYVRARPDEFEIVFRGGPNQTNVMPKRIIAERAAITD